MLRHLSLVLSSLLIFSGCYESITADEESTRHESEFFDQGDLSFLQDHNGVRNVYGFKSALVTDTLKMTWNDEFNGTALDGNKWSPAPEWPRQGGSFWSDKNYEMTGRGQVKLKVNERNGVVYAGAIRTHKKFDQKYGYFETRCQLPQIRGGWAAFWLMPYGNNPGGWGHDGTEIDVFESINGWNGKINHALHWDGYGAEHQKSSISQNRPDLYDGKYHTFGMLWTPDEYVFYIDNVESWRTDAGGVADVSQYLKLTLEVSSGTWAGNWNHQKEKSIDWLVDYVRVYDYKASHPQPQDPFDMSYAELTSGTSVSVGAQVPMDVKLTGQLSDADELQFLVRKGNGPFEVLKKTTIGSQTKYAQTWTPREPGEYSLRVTANKNGAYHTHVISSINVQGSLNPFAVKFETLSSGLSFSANESVPMNVLLTGDLTDVDELQFLTRIGNGDFIEVFSTPVNQLDRYDYSWTPTQAGDYNFRVTAMKKGAYVKHTVVNHITIEKPTEPLKIAYTALKNNDTHGVKDQIHMHVELSGDQESADELRYTLQRKGDAPSTIQSSSIHLDQSLYWNTWTPTEAGRYKLKVSAYQQGRYLTHTAAWVTITEPLKVKYRVLKNHSKFKLGTKINMQAEVSGDLSQTNRIKFVVQKNGGPDKVVKSSAIRSSKTIYHKKWTPSQPGRYKLKVQLYQGDEFITHQVSHIVVR